MRCKGLPTNYVIHLDPWWNPAVEDLATDRAHRIGQTRPVTVYRLVARGTLEEAILELHARKRDLVAGLLGGTGDAAQISTEELVALLSEARPLGVAPQPTSASAATNNRMIRIKVPPVRAHEHPGHRASPHGWLCAMPYCFCQGLGAAEELHGHEAATHQPFGTA